MENDNMQTNRMRFLTRLDRYLSHGHDRSEWMNDDLVSIRILCRRLWEDHFRYFGGFDTFMRDVCGHEYRTWVRLGGTWSAAARATAYFIDHAIYGDDGRPYSPRGMCVAEALKMPKPSVEWAVTTREVDSYAE